MMSYGCFVGDFGHKRRHSRRQKHESSSKLAIRRRRRGYISGLNPKEKPCPLLDFDWRAFLSHLWSLATLL
jgi:hypothetical protein